MATGFSYAQAAKGRAPAPSAESVSKPEPVPDQPALEVSAEPSEVSQSAEAPLNTDAEVRGRPDAEETPKNGDAAESASKATTVKSQSTSTISEDVTSSMAESAATLVKDDENAGAANDSESTTWEKISQESHPAEKGAPKSTGGSDDSKTSESWEHVQAPQPILKEAPPPTVNPWLKRAQDAKQAKAKSGVAPISQNTAVTAASNDAQNQRKKSRPTESESVAAAPAEKPTKGDEGPTRRYKPSSETRLASRLPPPTTDASFWPTPDSAKTDDKEKPKAVSQERRESADQDKDKAGKRGQNKWEKIEFVPTAVFNTPMPTGRRGGRPSGRGGRDAGVVRGGNNPTGNDRASEGDENPAPAEAPVERSKSDAGHPRNSQTVPRPKRMSQNTQTKPRDLKKIDDSNRGAGTETTTSHDIQKSEQTNTSASESDQRTTSSKNPVDQASPNGVDQADGSSFDHSRTPRHFRDGRGEFNGQGREFNREGGGTHREGRAERGGRGGSRGRGGHGGYAYGTYPPGDRNGNYSSSSSFGTPKSHGYDRQNQYQNFGSAGRGEKHFRSGSRTQGAPPPRFGGYQGMAPFAPNAVPPETAQGYGYPTAMQQPYYHPAMDQGPLLGVIAEQMKYYFSVDNLVRDVYLRKRMDDQGFIPLTFMMPWKRMAMMTSDISLVRYACLQVSEVELRMDINGVDYIRPAQDWQQWILKHEDRLEDARNEGPHLQPIQGAFSHQYPQPQFIAAYPAVYPQQGYSPRNGQHRSVNGNSPRHDSAGGQGPLNGQSHGATDVSPSQTPLSATVPEFQPDPAFGSQSLEVGGQDVFPDHHMNGLTVTKNAEAQLNGLSNGSTATSVESANLTGHSKSTGPIVAAPTDNE